MLWYKICISSIELGKELSMNKYIGGRNEFERMEDNLKKYLSFSSLHEQMIYHSIVH